MTMDVAAGRTRSSGDLPDVPGSPVPGTTIGPAGPGEGTPEPNITTSRYDNTPAVSIRATAMAAPAREARPERVAMRGQCRPQAV